MNATAHETPLDVLIVGAGWSGLAALHHARERGLTARVVESAPEVGGTWYWNRYPGLRVDIESWHYSYSFDHDLEQEYVWEERYPTRDALLAYAMHVADRFDLRRDIDLNTTLTSLAFDEATDTWHAKTDAGHEYASRFVVLATGALSMPKPVNIPGAVDFEGLTLHTARWPGERPDLEGKRIAVIGTGSTGIQVSTELAKIAGDLFVCQRTPSFTLPAFNRELADGELDAIKADYATLRENARHSIDGLSLPQVGPSILEASPDERERVLWDVYRGGVPFSFQGIYGDIMFDQQANDLVRAFIADRVRERVGVPDLAEKLIPAVDPVGTRRLCIDSGYYEIFRQPNVHLVDLLEAGIERIEPAGIRRTDGSFIELDAIVFATGYDAFTGPIGAIDITGAGGATMRDAWADGARTYLGVAVHGFPNLFLVTGPQSPSVLSNMFVSIEQHVDWIIDCIEQQRVDGVRRIEATAEAQEAWVEHAAELSDILLHGRTTSWYIGANVPGKARVVLPYLGGVGPFRAKCDEVAASGYEGFERVGA